MAQAQGSLQQLAWVAESVYGTTPASPSTQLLEFVSFDGTESSEQLSSATIRPDRQTSYSRRGNVSAEGTLVVELTPDNYDFLFEMGLMGTWTSNVLTIGTVNRSIAIEQSFPDIDQHRLLNGLKVDTISMEVTTDELVSVSFGLFGATGTALSATRIDESPTAVTSKDIYFHEGGTFLEDGVAIAYLASLSWELNNNTNGTRALGNTGFRHVNAGKVNVTGSGTALVEGNTLYNKYMNDEETSFSFTLTAGSPAETMTFTFHRVKLTSATLNAPGDGGVTMDFEWEAIYDPTAGNTMSITRSA